MADENEDVEEEPKKKGKGGLLIGLVLAVLAGGGAFAFASGMLGGGSTKEEPKKMTLSDDLAFVSLEPMTVSIGNPTDRRYLRFRAELEVDSGLQSDVEKMLPRVMDVLNTYLQSLEMEDIEDPSSLLTLRSQMRRRIDLVVGGDRVHDLLVMEFVVN
ncbi:MAG: flagellar basal body-associated FliL family protein [Paracoccaceae bacterium]|nr:flagellar basal body-associated FliL family protein [Paracoccaceae bacterium]